MSRQSWAENYYNTERNIFTMGHWTLTEDGEHSRSLYYDGECVESVLFRSKYHLLENGFLLYYITPSENSYGLYLKDNKQPIFECTGKDVNVDIAKDFITFINGDTKIMFDSYSLTRTNINDENQLGFDL